MSKTGIKLNPDAGGMVCYVTGHVAKKLVDGNFATYYRSEGPERATAPVPAELERATLEDAPASEGTNRAREAKERAKRKAAPKSKKTTAKAPKRKAKKA